VHDEINVIHLADCKFKSIIINI